MGFYGISGFAENVVQWNNIDDIAHQFYRLFAINTVVVNLLTHFLKLQKNSKQKKCRFSGKFSLYNEVQ